MRKPTRRTCEVGGRCAARLLPAERWALVFRLTEEKTGVVEGI